ncbi:MAG: hypothetical protein KZQ86_18190 [Candidatus Thiodiazotropha sp. (ex Lucinoma kastoroae)]|nr:hypothetical protein [Candidatus Thiodiazotropha sp. (ex Lucinoma kastoroae)]
MILLVIITMLSVTAMRNTNLETKIAVNHQLKELNFRGVEDAFAIVTGPELDSIGLDIPSTIGDITQNICFFKTYNDGSGPCLNIDPVFDPALALALAEQPRISVDATVEYEAKIDPKEGEGNILFSGHQLDIITHLFLVDAFGTIGDSSTSTHNRMQVALIRQ